MALWCSRAGFTDIHSTIVSTVLLCFCPAELKLCCATSCRSLIVQVLAGVAQVIKISEAVLGEDHGIEDTRRITLPYLRTADYRASVPDIAEHLLTLMRDPALRQRMGEAGRKRVTELFDYREVARRFVGLMSSRLGIE